MSIDTLEITRSLSVKADQQLQYQHVFLLIRNKQHRTRLLNFTNGTFIHDLPEIRCKYPGLYEVNLTISCAVVDIVDIKSIYLYGVEIDGGCKIERELMDERLYAWFTCVIMRVTTRQK